MDIKTLEELKDGVSMFKSIALIHIKDYFKEKKIDKLNVIDSYKRDDLGIRSIELRLKNPEEFTTNDTIYVVQNDEQHSYLWFNELSIEDIIKIYEWIFNNYIK